MNYLVRFPRSAGRMASATVLLMMLVACQQTSHFQTTATAAISPLLFCDGYRPVRWSVKDTRETQNQIVPNNRIFKEECQK